MELGSEDRDLVHPEASSTPKTETDLYIAPDVYIAPAIQKIGSPSIAQIESRSKSGDYDDPDCFLFGGDPVASGFVASLNHPGGNLIG